MIVDTLFGWFIAEKTLNYALINTSFFNNKPSPNYKMRQEGKILDLKTSGQIELLISTAKSRGR